MSLRNPKIFVKCYECGTDLDIRDCESDSYGDIILKVADCALCTDNAIADANSSAEHEHEQEMSKLTAEVDKLTDELEDAKAEAETKVKEAYNDGVADERERHG